MNFAGTFISLARTRFRDNIAVEENGNECTYAALASSVCKVGNALRHLGITQGKVVAGLMHNRTELLETNLACSAIGAISAFMGANSSEKEIIHALNLSDAEILVYESDHYTITDEIRRNCNVRHYIAVGADPKGDLSYEALKAQASDQLALDSYPSNTPHSIHFTSGTTGLPKGVLLAYNNWLRIYYHYLSAIDSNASSTDVALFAAPLTHASGMLVMPHLHTGGKLLVMNKFDPGRINTLIASGKVTSSFMAPTMIQLLMKEMTPSERKPGRLKTLVYGGASFPVERLREALEIYGPVLVQGYGQWEAPIAFSVLSREMHVEALEKHPECLGSAGMPALFTEVAILDDDGNELEPGSVGEIATSGPHVMLEYLKNPEATAEIRSGRWQRTGDIGHFDPDGYLYVTDRKKDMIITGGMNVYPRQIEEVLYEHPQIHEACVVGVPNELWGEIVHAVIVRRAGESLTEDDVLEWSETKLKSHQKVRSVSFVEELPKNNTGKVLRRHVRTAVMEPVS